MANCNLSKKKKKDRKDDEFCGISHVVERRTIRLTPTAVLPCLITTTQLIRIRPSKFSDNDVINFQRCRELAFIRLEMKELSSFV